MLQKFKEIIKKKGMSMTYVAQKLEISRHSLYDKIKGIRQFTLDEAGKLAELLEVSITFKKNQLCITK